MMSARLHAIASFLEKEDRVADVGCDHAYLAIYLIKNQLCQSVVATDVNQNALENAKQNIKKEGLDKEIPVVLSDGLENLEQSKIDTIVISGMGTSTILHILKKVEKDKIKKIILQSNNDLYYLRKKVKKLGYFLKQEKVVLEKGHHYVIGEYTKQKRKLKRQEFYFGLFREENRFYYEHLWRKYQKINEKIPYKHWKKKLRILYEMHLLKNYVNFLLFKEKK